MKRTFLPLVFLSISVVAALGAVLWWKVSMSPVSTDKTPLRFVVPKGKTASQISQKLYSEGIIKSPLAFKLYVQLTGKSEKIQAGEFELSKSLTPSEIVEVLSKGPLQLWVTIPEGLRREEIVERIITGLEMKGDVASDFRQQFLLLAADSEGFLFPDTYLFPRDASPQKVVSTLKNTFDKRIDAKTKEDVSKSGKTLEQVVIMASILEKETKNKDPNERPTVAGILWKRLDKNWPLQADATVQYALASVKCKGKVGCDWWPKSLTKEDLEISSPYNSYKNSTLPPSPISNPGLSAIKASLYPQESDYWFYLHDTKGDIHYAKDLEEHNENVKLYLGK